MMMGDLRMALAERGIDNPDAVLEKHGTEAVSVAIEHWDARSRTQTVGPGLLVQMIRDGAPAAKPNLTSGHLKCFACGRSFDPSKSAIKGRKVAPSMDCNACLSAGYEQGRWQERFLYDSAVES